MSDGVTGNTSDSESEDSRFEPWSDNKVSCQKISFFVWDNPKSVSIKCIPIAQN